MISVGGEVILGGSASVVTSGRISQRPASPAAGDVFYCTDFDVTLRCRAAGAWVVAGVGPLAVTRGPFATDVLIKSAPNTGLIAGGPSTTIAVGLHVASLPGASLKIIAECHTDTPTPSDSGWYLATSGSTANRLILYLAGINGGTPVNLGIDLVTGPVSIAIAVTSTHVRASSNGGAVVATAITGTYVPPTTGAQLSLGSNYPSGSVISFSVGSMAWFEAWGSALSDAALVAISGANATYLPGEAGADPIAAWPACRTRRSDGYADTIGAQGAPLTVAAGLPWTAR